MSGPSRDRPVALITGAARRVGLAIAQEFAAAGCDLIITYRTSAAEAQAAANELSGTGAQVRLERLDLADLDGAERWAGAIASQLPRLDVLVHNASVYAPTPLNKLTAESLLENFNVHAAAPALLTKHLAPLISRSPLAGGGSIVAMCDIHALGRPRRDYLSYAMSKAALAEMVRSLARDLAPRVRVNGVAPGAVQFADSGPDADPEMQRRYLSRVPLGRSGTPQEAAAVVRWLALDATYITGEIIRVDGGRWIT